MRLVASYYGIYDANNFYLSRRQMCEINERAAFYRKGRDVPWKYWFSDVDRLCMFVSGVFERFG